MSLREASMLDRIAERLGAEAYLNGIRFPSVDFKLEQLLRKHKAGFLDVLSTRYHWQLGWYGKEEELDALEDCG